MATMSPAELAEKYIQRMANAVAQVKKGVRAVTKSPTEAAAAKADQYVAGVQRAVNEGRFQAGLRAVSLAEWQEATAGKGADRIAEGARSARGKMEAFFAALLPVTDRVKQTVAAMPKGTPEDSRARMNAAFDMMSQFRYKGRR